MLTDELYEETMDTQTYQIIVSSHQKSLRLDRFIAESIPRISRTRVQLLIENGHILRNGRVIDKASLKVTPGDILTISIPQRRPLAVEPEMIPLQIVYEDDDLIVINKPPDMVVHPAAGNRTGTLVNALAHYCTTLSTAGGYYRPGIIHRLDKDTSGTIIAAKNDVAHNEMARKFEHRKIEKYYLALVWGSITPSSGVILDPIGRDPSNRKKFAVVPDGKDAETRYKVLADLDFLSLVRLRIITGRTHQIRVHMAYSGHPVLGDSTYGGRTKKLKSLKPRQREKAVQVLDCIHRQALHSYEMFFDHPRTGEPIHVRSNLPRDMCEVLEILGYNGESVC
ncbi:MAG: Pseudouridine synthase [Marinimicrobia bacterium 46_47]|nr:MAG: Pseudouridine synthase [Marinimicrobia bacterium 46_47]KUK91092.1 MAG: ribosomal large subunit pseudouridine synthase D [Marinimicrobia bacterium 46_43]